MLKSAEQMSRLKEFRRLDDGRYLFRDQPWSRTVILDAETAVQVFEAREKGSRRGVWLAGLGGLLGYLTFKIFSDNLAVALSLFVAFILLPLGCYTHFLHQKAYGRMIRKAPTASERLPFEINWNWDWELLAGRLPPAIAKFGVVVSPILGIFFCRRRGTRANDPGDQLVHVRNRLRTGRVLCRRYGILCQDLAHSQK